MTAPPLPALATLTEAQRAGAACIRCGHPLHAGVPVGAVDGVSLWTCIYCARPEEGPPQIKNRALCTSCRLPEDDRPGGGMVPVRIVASASGPERARYAHTRCTTRAGYTPDAVHGRPGRS